MVGEIPSLNEYEGRNGVKHARFGHGTHIRRGSRGRGFEVPNVGYGCGWFEFKNGLAHFPSLWREVVQGTYIVASSDTVHVRFSSRIYGPGTGFPLAHAWKETVRTWMGTTEIWTRFRDAALRHF